jgi:hypothetical protein
MWSPRVRAAVALVVSTAGMSFAVVLGIALAASLRERSTYQAAEACSRGQAEGSGECWRDVSGIVERKHSRTYKLDSFALEVRLTDAEQPLPREIGIPSDTPVFEALQAGEAVRLRMFRGHVVQISTTSGTLVTEEAPQVAAALRLVGAWLISAVSGLGFALGLGFIRESKSLTGASWRRVREAARRWTRIRPVGLEARAGDVLFPLTVGGTVITYLTLSRDVTDLTDLVAAGLSVSAVIAMLIGIHKRRQPSHSDVDADPQVADSWLPSAGGHRRI